MNFIAVPERNTPALGGWRLGRVAPATAAMVLDAVLILTLWLCFALASGDGPMTLLYPATTLGGLYAFGLYRRELLVASRAALARLPVAVGAGALGGLVLLLMLPPAWRPAQSAALFPLAFAGFTAAGFAGRAVLRGLRARAVFRTRLLVVGAGKRAWELAFLLQREGRNLAYDVTFVHDPARGEVEPHLVAFGAVVEAHDLLAVARRVRADAIVMAPDERRGMALDSLLDCKVAGFPVQDYLGFLERELRRIDIKRLDMSWIAYGEGFSFGPIDRWLKRLTDVVVSGAMLLVLSPFLLAAALAVKLGDGGPVLYRQERVTLHGATFRVLKLRTMRQNAEAQGAVWAAERDPRITRAGAFLRRTRLDEVPQLLNVLGGSMSLVGPRPERPEFVAKLSKAIPLYHLRHSVKAGLTGWAQINYPYGASIDDARSKLSYDLYYIKNVGVLFDLLIVAQTIRAVLWPSGVR
jgi:sugar transferase (PEP-CTERM system associated)